jgi:Protein kinase domain
MAITIGQELGSYEITALLGKGGMGEVYRARDTKLKREVAIKILPDEFLRDSERVARFQREAEIVASLNHPHIATIYFRSNALRQGITHRDLKPASFIAVVPVAWREAWAAFSDGFFPPVWPCWSSPTVGATPRLVRPQASGACRLPL